MSDTTPASDAWLRDLIDRSPLLADRTVRRAWRDLVPVLPTDQRYTLAAILLDVEQSLAADG